jgi:hypothetical protein
MFQEFMNTSMKRTIVVETSNDRMIISFQTKDNGMIVDLSTEEADRLITLISQARSDIQQNSTNELLGEISA